MQGEKPLAFVNFWLIAWIDAAMHLVLNSLVGKQPLVFVYAMYLALLEVAIRTCQKWDVDMVQHGPVVV